MNSRAGTTLSLVREFDRPPERVWSAWAEPAAMVQWLGPASWPAIEVEADVRVGGAWRAVLRSVDGRRVLRQLGRTCRSNRRPSSSSPSAGRATTTRTARASTPS